MISVTTASGRIRPEPRVSRSRSHPTLANTITGEALTTQVSLTPGLLGDLFGTVLEWRNAEA